MPITRWNAAAVKRNIGNEAERRVLRACVYVKGKIQRSINRGNPTGKNPSRPGEPPKKVSSQLYQGIGTRVVRTSTGIDGYVTSSKEYTARLEFGFMGVDARGRNISQEARPFMRPGVTNNRAAIARILRTGR